ncbi:hypothetical protein PVAG01_00132 [Phlyctema vagabunda]|uniref:Uncharacterized protein n=1 Tax=Phlyctema vagabunda TaxID=108571 RepID=A0ABR4PTU6_9HELO
MTAVIRISEKGILSAVQVGPAEIVATLTAASSAWGWIGGLSGVRNLFSYVRNKRAITDIEALVKVMAVEPITCQVLTSHGIVRFDDLDARDAFGGTLETQLLGQTICALAHECGGRQAVYLFMECLAPKLFPGDTQMAGLREALRAQLNDNVDKILEEGAGRSLTQKFINAIRAAELPAHSITTPGRDDRPFTIRKFESFMVGGLLQWLGQHKTRVYHTRSGLVMRVAVCLREVGYEVGELVSWDGQNAEPQISRGVVLVLGGTKQTDTLMLSETSPFYETVFFQHYRFQTIGSMFVNGLPQFEEEYHPEPFQTIFDKVMTWVGNNLSFDWNMVHKDANVGLQAVPKWVKQARKPSSEARRLASFYFTNSGDFLADCYQFVGIADERHVAAVVSSLQRGSNGNGPPKELVKFRVLTASILFAVSSLLGGKDFPTLQHVTSVDMSFSPFSSISTALEILDSGLIDSLSLGRAVDIVAAVHAGAILAKTRQSEVEEHSVGYRNGIYGVLPSLLFAMKPTRDALGLRCVDQYFGTVPVHPDRYIRSIRTSRLSFYTGSQSLTGQDQSIRGNIGPLEILQPDVPLYLNIERNAEDMYPNISLAGRVNGQLIGYVTIQDVVESLAENLETDSTQIRAHAKTRDVYNVAPSFWAQRWNDKPRIQGYSTHVSAGNDACWAIFLAGQAASFGVCMLLNFPDSLVGLDPEKEHVIITYNESQHAENQQEIVERI